MSLFAPYNVVNDPTTHNPQSYSIVVGTFDFADDRMARKSGGRRQGLP